ncbi:MAG: DUF3016 domain-containing protein [Chitinophagaceae bacterium]|nr:DUF3016 domain-containing protein [Rubrivivax sp.]
MLSTSRHSRHPRQLLSPGRLAIGAALASACWVLPVAAMGTLEVKYVQAEQFSDIGFGAFERERNLQSMTQVLQGLVKRLPDGQTLRLEVLDIDLAGETYPRSAGRDLRVLRGGVDWPRMEVRYTLQADGRTLKAGEDKLADQSYLFTLRGQTAQDGPLPYEKRMLARWFSDTFAAVGP